MEKLKQGLVTAIVAVATGGALMVMRPGLVAATPVTDSVVALPSSPWTSAELAQPIEQQLSSAVQAILHGSR
jgi:hypothetical protein